jgi:hypothetical protein
VLVNQTLYYPGDSFTLPEGITPPVLAVPTSGPWLKPGESIDFVLAVKPKLAFATHDFHASDAGSQLVNSLLVATCQSVGTVFKNLAVGESLNTEETA